MKISSRNAILAGVSVLAVALAIPATAQTTPQNPTEAQAGTVEQTTNPRGPVVTEQDIRQGWENTKESVSNTTKDVGNAIEEKYEDVKAVLIDDDDRTTQTTFVTKTYAGGNSAKTLIGRSVKDATGNTVATVHDIIVERDGDAKMLVLSDGGFFGIGGKNVALDYDSVVISNDVSETIRPVSKDMLKNVAEFTYSPTNSKARMIPADGVSLRHTLNSALLDSQNKKLATIENVIIEGGDADKMIVSFDKVLGLGGEYAALDFDDVTVIRGKDGKVEFQLSAGQAAAFENYKKSVTN